MKSKKNSPLVLWWRTDANGRVRRRLRCNESDNIELTPAMLIPSNFITFRGNTEIELSQASNGPATSSSRYEKVKKRDWQRADSALLIRQLIRSSDAESAH